MGQWISANSDILQIALNAVMVLVWIVYLQVFSSGFLRQRRPEILITFGAGIGPKTNWFVTNLGLEPIFIVDVIVQLETGKETREASVTDRTELGEHDVSSPAEATTQGPLSSGDFMSIGNVETVLFRAHDPSRPDEDLQLITVLVVAATASRNSIVGASRRFRVKIGEDGDRHVAPTQIATRQITDRAGVAQLKEKLRAYLQ